MSYTKNAIPSGDWLTKSIKQSRVTVGVTATPLPATALKDRRLLIVENNSGVTIYLGDSTVTPTNGFPLANGTSFSINLDEKVTLYGIEAVGDRDIRVFEGA